MAAVVSSAAATDARAADDGVEPTLTVRSARATSSSALTASSADSTSATWALRASFSSSEHSMSGESTMSLARSRRVGALGNSSTRARTRIVRLKQLCFLQSFL